MEDVTYSGRTFTSKTNDAAKRKAIINPVSGEEVETVNRDIFKADPALIKAARAAISTKGAKSIRKKKKK